MKRQVLIFLTLSLLFARAAQAGEIAIVKDKWLPSQTQADEAISVLKAHLASPNPASQWAIQGENWWEKKERATVLRHIDLYQLRLTGVVGVAQPALAAPVEGHKVVRINGFCRPGIGRPGFVNDWRSPSHIVMDGGDCFFHADYDTQTKTIAWFGVNGGGTLPENVWAEIAKNQ